MDDLDIVILAASSSEKFKDSSSLLNDKGLIHSALGYDKANKNANQDQQPNNGNLPGVDNANLRVDTSETQAENRRRRRSSNSFSTQNIILFQNYHLTLLYLKLCCRFQLGILYCQIC